MCLTNEIVYPTDTMLTNDGEGLIEDLISAEGKYNWCRKFYIYILRVPVA